MRENRPIIEMPRIIDVRPGAINHLEDTLKRLNLEGNGLMIAGKTTVEVAGKQIISILEDKNYNIDTMLIGDATVSVGKEAIEKIAEVDADFVLAVGGGTKIDVAKYASFNSNIPFISIPTVASHDGIASSRASLKGMDTKHSFEAHSPLAVVGDVLIVSQAPKQYMISGCADVISNKTAVLDWQLSNRLTGEHVSQYAITLSLLIANTIIEQRKIIKTDLLEGTNTVLKGLMTSSISMCIAGSSRPASGAEHMISHRLDHLIEKPALHGMQCGVASIVTMFLHGGDWKEIRDTLHEVGAPIRADEIGVDRDQMIEAVISGQDIRPERFTILSNGITKKAAVHALTVTGIID
ncbi:MAG: NAD(P)-dependent glycerol-1-phosphate dehydrogenase [Candidatus Kariarchaeaceae archaeon]|jgi:glycerol-1-phosphate dehydrogenase [NAD(P)+]